MRQSRKEPQLLSVAEEVTQSLDGVLGLDGTPANRSRRATAAARQATHRTDRFRLPPEMLATLCAEHELNRPA